MCLHTSRGEVFCVLYMLNTRCQEDDPYERGLSEVLGSSPSQVTILIAQVEERRDLVLQRRLYVQGHTWVYNLLCNFCSSSTMASILFFSFSFFTFYFQIYLFISTFANHRTFPLSALHIHFHIFISISTPSLTKWS